MNDNGCGSPYYLLCGPLLSLSHFTFFILLLSLLNPNYDLLPSMLLLRPAAMESHARNDSKRSLQHMASACHHDLNFSDDNINDKDPAGDNPVPDDDRMRRPAASSAGKRSGGAAPPSCQIESCTAVLADAKKYHRRHKVCEFHAKAPVVVVAGLRQRFCQQCSRFHELSEFDEAKRSCRRRLAGHNERRRKVSTSEAPGGDDQMKESQCRGAPDERGTSSAYKNFQIR